MASSITRLGRLVLPVVLTSPVLAQGSDRGALAILRGSDTLVVDRFIRSADTLRGSVQVRGQPRIDYLVRLAPNDRVQSLTIGVYAPGAAPDASPLQRVRVAIPGDTAIVETQAGTQRIAAKAGAIPSFNNALAVSELFTRRARATGGIADIPYFSLTGGATIDAQVRPVGADSMSVAIAQQVSRFRVDAVG